MGGQSPAPWPSTAFSQGSPEQEAGVMSWGWGCTQAFQCGSGATGTEIWLPHEFQGGPFFFLSKKVSRILGEIAPNPFILAGNIAVFWSVGMGCLSIHQSLKFFWHVFRCTRVSLCWGSLLLSVFFKCTLEFLKFRWSLVFLLLLYASSVISTLNLGIKFVIFILPVMQSFPFWFHLHGWTSSRLWGQKHLYAD